MIDKICTSVQAALAGIADGATVMIGGFGGAGQPGELIDALIEQGARDLVVVNNNAGNGETGLAALLKTGRADALGEVALRYQFELDLAGAGQRIEHLRVGLARGRSR